MIDHVSATVKNLDKSCKFYTELFGLKVIRSWERKEHGLISKSLGTENRGLIELIESSESRKANKKKNATDFVPIVSQPGVTHLSFPVKDMEGTLTKLKKLGGNVLDGPRKGITVESFAFVEDPDGIVIEIVQLHPRDVA